LFSGARRSSLAVRKEEPAAGGMDAPLERRLDQAIAQIEAWPGRANHLMVRRAQGTPPADGSFITDIPAGNILVPFCFFIAGAAKPSSNRAKRGDGAPCLPGFGN